MEIPKALMELLVGDSPASQWTDLWNVIFPQEQLVWRSRPEREAQGSGDSRIMQLYNLTENWCVQ